MKQQKSDSSEQFVITEQVAHQIEGLVKAVSDLRRGRLNDRAILILLSEASRVPRTQVLAVLNGIANLEKTYLKPSLKTKR